jgi:hypothetical protein
MKLVIVDQGVSHVVTESLESYFQPLEDGQPEDLANHPAHIVDLVATVLKGLGLTIDEMAVREARVD